MSARNLATVVVLLVGWVVIVSPVRAQAAQRGQDWPVYGGDPGGMKYSPLTQINRSNVHELELAWIWKTGEQPIPRPAQGALRPGLFEATPLMIGDTLYLSTPYHRVVALDANAGTELWSYDPRVHKWPGRVFLSRGVATWTDGQERRIFINSRWRLIALDATTGDNVGIFEPLIPFSCRDSVARDTTLAGNSPSSGVLSGRERLGGQVLL